MDTYTGASMLALPFSMLNGPIKGWAKDYSIEHPAFSHILFYLLTLPLLQTYHCSAPHNPSD